MAMKSWIVPGRNSARAYPNGKPYSPCVMRMPFLNAYINRIGNMDDAVYEIFCLARRGGTGAVTPQQGECASSKEWQQRMEKNA